MKNPPPPLHHALLALHWYHNRHGGTDQHRQAHIAKSSVHIRLARDAGWRGSVRRALLDEEITLLAILAKRMNQRQPGPSRTSVAKIIREIGASPMPRRERTCIAWRFLRRHTVGPWHRGGNHVGRPNFGPSICFETRSKKVTAYAEPGVGVTRNHLRITASHLFHATHFKA